MLEYFIILAGTTHPKVGNLLKPIRLITIKELLWALLLYQLSNMLVPIELNNVNKAISRAVE